MPRVLLLPLLAVALLTGACGSDERPATDLAGPSPHVREHREATRDASPKPDRPRTASPTPSGTPGSKAKSAPLLPTRRNVLASHLLEAARMPGLADGAAWSVVDDGTEDTEAVGACQKTALESIGAVSAVRRSFAAGDVGHATQVVARFADDKSAWRAHEVLRSWREDCEQRLDFERREIGPLESVTVRVGTADTYRAAFGPRAVRRGRVAGFGIVRTGSFLSIVEISSGRGAYPTDREPAHAAVRRIARTFA